MCECVCLCVCAREIVALFLKFASGCNLEETTTLLVLLLYFLIVGILFLWQNNNFAKSFTRLSLCASSFAVSLLFHIRVFVLPASLATPFSNMKSHVQLVPLTLSLALMLSCCMRFVCRSNGQRETQRNTRNCCRTSANCALCSNSPHCLLKQQ